MLSEISRDDYQKIKAVLADALQITPAERGRFVEAACRGDEKLRGKIEALLAVENSDDNFLEDFSAFSVLNESISNSDKYIDLKIGNYRLEREIGRGGMGVVFLATREDFQQQVAVKLIKRGMDSDAVLERFTREREILAALNHPFIARLTDGGTTGRDTPYFVMEYVDGLPIDRYCGDSALPEKEILELFRKVCEAVSFAHQKLVIHRDLKPSNILVTADGTPKLLDFGIAKLLNRTDGQETQTQQRMLTPLYSSPEQIANAAVDTTSDVYSLGVILSELLTGRRLGENGARPPGQTSPLIPDRPPFGKPFRSLKLKFAAAGREQAAGAENSTGPNLLKGDLGNIVAKALKPEPARRYASVEQFSEDICRYLEGLPVRARRATAAYRAAKLIRRNKLIFAAGLLILLTLLGGIIATTIQRSRADRQRLRAETDEYENHRLLYAARMSLAYQAWETSNTGRAVDLLETQKAETGEDDLHGFEWRLLWGLTHDGARILREPAEKFSSVVFSPDGSRVAAGGASGKVYVWDAATGQSLNTFDSHTNNWVSSIFSPDGKYLAVGCADGVTLLWEAGTGKLIRKFAGQTGVVSAVAFSPDGQMLAASSFDHTVRVWKTETGAPLAVLDRHTDVVASVKFSPDGKTIATGSYDHTIKLWNIASGRELATLKGHAWWVLTIAFSPDGKLLATSGSDGNIKFWDVSSRRNLRTISGEGTTINQVSFSPDGKTLAAANSDSTAKIYDVSSGTLKNVLRGHTDIVYAAAFSPDGQTLASVSSDRTIRLWNLARQSGTAILEGHTDWVWNLAFSPDGKRLATASKDATVKIWNVRDESRIITLAHPQWVNGVAFSPNGQTLATASDDTFVRLWNPETGQILLTLNENETIAECVAFSPDGHILAAGSKKGDIKLWETETGKELAAFRSPGQNLIWSLAFSPDGKYLVSGEGGLNDFDKPTGHMATVRNLATGQIEATLEGHTSDVRAAIFSPDGKTLVTGSYDRTIKFWDAVTFREIATLQSDSIQALAFSADGTRLVSASSNKTVKIWDPQSFQELCTLTVPGVVNSAAFSPDNKILAAASSDNRVRLWTISDDDQ